MGCFRKVNNPWNGVFKKAIIFEGCSGLWVYYVGSRETKKTREGRIQIWENTKLGLRMSKI